MKFIRIDNMQYNEPVIFETKEDFLDWVNTNLEDNMGYINEYEPITDIETAIDYAQDWDYTIETIEE